MIRFRCPNGHALTAEIQLAGRSGRCPKCQAGFIVPAEDAGPTAASSAALAVSPSAISPQSGSGKQTASRDLFIFLCPNGHKLNGPSSMKGKAGQCPECGARFRIPTDEEIAEAEQAEEEEELTSAPPDSDEEVAPAPAEGDTALGPGASVPNQPAAAGAISPPPLGVSGLAHLVSQLWQWRTETTELEIFLNEGEIMSPDFYSEVLSSGDYGVFAVQEGDGTYTISVIPWANVRRVGLRRLDDLPLEPFP